MYPTQAVAEDALIAAWTAYEYKKGNGPVNVYLCDICGTYHLTSKGDMNKKLSDYVASGALDRNAVANRWLDKLKKK
jgi:hypothetical protein